MSGLCAMEVCADDALVEGCDEVLSDVCLTFAESLVRLAGGVIAGVKPAAIFGMPFKAYRAGRWHRLEREQLDEVLRTYAATLPAYGVSLSVLYRTKSRVFVLVWRPRHLNSVVSDPEHMEILRSAGYTGASAPELVAELRRRLVDYYLSNPSEGHEFPHEIGVFLGYPASDVRGFMAGLKPTCIGAWHAYGDESVAQQRFSELREHEHRCRRRYAAGEPLSSLFAVGA